MQNLYVDDLEIHLEESLQSIPIKENSNFKKDKIGIFLYMKNSPTSEKDPNSSSQL